MAFTIQEYLDLVRLLAEHPEWRAELRRLLLSDDVLALPTIVRDLVETQRRTEAHIEALAEAQRQTEVRLERLEGVVQELAEAQRRTEARLERLEGVVQELAEAQRRTEERLERLEGVVHDLVEVQRKTIDTVGGLKGRVLEITYREKASAYFGPLLRRVRVVTLDSLEDTLETHLASEEFREVFLLDLVVSGQLRHDRTLPEVWLAVEISAVVDQDDVNRAQRRAMILRQAGYQAIPVVAGENVTPEAEAIARQQHVVMLQDGRIFQWEEALRTWVVQNRG